MATPLWLSQLTWCPARLVAAVRGDHVPSLPGVYMFTASPAAPAPGQVLYIGKAIDLRNRLGGYLVDYRVTTPTKHKGRAFLFEYRDKHGDNALFVRWAIIGDPILVEGALIEYFEPEMNDKWETVFLADDETIDLRWLP